MSDRQDIQSRHLINGRPYFINIIHNPTIDDVVITEARIHASEIDTGTPASSEDRRVQRDIRDFLIRLGVER